MTRRAEPCAREATFCDAGQTYLCYLAPPPPPPSAECLLQVVRVCVAADERHRDPSAVDWHLTSQSTSSGGAAGGGSRADLLIAKLQVWPRQVGAAPPG